MSDIDDVRRMERALQEVQEGAEEPMESDLHPDRTRGFSSTGFSRMRTSWNPDEQAVISHAHDAAERALMSDFGDVYQIVHRLYEIVREPVEGPDGQPQRDRRGLTVWRRDVTGMYVEDWSRLTERDKESFLHQITTRLVTWEQKSADFWAEAMYAKVTWEGRFADAFLSTPRVDNRRPTVDDRTQHAQHYALEDRYLGIFMSVRSRKAEALVRSMERLALRLRDTSL